MLYPSGLHAVGEKRNMIKRKVSMKNFKTWLRAAGVRALKTVAQTAVASIGSAAVFSAIDWRVVASASLLAGILSLLTSVAGLPETKEGKNEQ